MTRGKRGDRDVQAPEGLTGHAAETFDPTRTEIYISGAGRPVGGPRAGKPPSLPPAANGWFRPLRFIDRGAYGEVWEATQISLDRTVAVKRLRDDVVPDTPDGHRQVESFRREVKTTAALEHPNIIPVYDAGEDENGYPQLAMKLVRGTTWGEMLDEDRALPRAEFFSRHLPVLTDVAQAVSYAHSRGVIHRDIKPSQILVGEFGEVLLVDWGLAFFLDDLGGGDADGASESEDRPAFNNTVTAVCPAGTPAYMAPEQTEESPDGLGPWTDVYLLGGVLYYLLTGTHLREGSDAAAAVLSAARGEIEAPSRRSPELDIPADLEELALAALSPMPEARPSAAEFIAGIQGHLSGASQRRESVALTDQVEAALKHDREGYDELAQCLSTLDRAEGLWVGNPVIAELREESLIAFAETALANRDLELARRQAGRLTSEARRLEIVDRVEKAAERYRRTARQRRLFARVSVVLGIVLLVSGVKYTLDQQRARVRLAEQRNAADAARMQAESLAEFMLRDLTPNLEAIGRLDLLDQVAKEAVAYYENLPIEEASPSAMMRRSQALRNVGRVLRSQGDLADARTAIDASLFFIRKVIEREPDSAVYRAELADRLLGLGTLMVLTSDRDGAALAFGESAGLFESLCARSPKDRDLRRGLVTALGGLGWEHWSRSEYGQAEEVLRRADSMLLALVEEEPEDTDSVRALLENHAMLGGVLRDRGELEDSARLVGQAIALGDRLVEAEPSNVLNLDALSDCASSLGFTLWQMEDLQGSLAAYEKACSIDRRLAQQDPTNASRQRQLASSLSNVGEMRRGLGDLPGALQAVTAAVEILDPLVAGNPDHAGWRYALATSHVELGRIHRLMGDERSAVERWERAAKLMEVVAVERGDLYYLDTYVSALLLLGRIDEAKPVVEELRSRGWESGSFIELCEERGL